MNIIFKWQKKLDARTREAFQGTVMSDIKESSEFTPCHPGNIYVNVSFVNPSDMQVEGEIKCSCGREYISFRGKCISEDIFYIFS
ncbi:MAG: hypothetical protein SCH71_04400 [Desulfobulbaceae bacterium]|nr:hypothetical protein [Desulfobulbaceae bacterium]